MAGGDYWTITANSPRISRPTITGFNPTDVVIELDLDPGSWQPASGAPWVAHFRNAGGDDHLILQIQSPGLIRLNRYNPSNAVVAVGEVPTTGMTGRRIIRIRHYGPGPFLTDFYQKSPPDTDWTFLGQRSYSGTLKPLGSALHYLGSAGGGQPYTGKFYGGTIRDGATGAALAAVDPSQYQASGSVPDSITPSVNWTVGPATAPVPGWDLSQPWPGTPGGADSPHWGGIIRLYVWLAISAGSTFAWGDSATDNLDAGNVWGGGSVGPTPPAGRLWVDVTCDVRRLETHLGGTKADGALSKTDAGTCAFTLADPDRAYDPLNPDSPWQYAGRSRLAPGTPVWVWAETVHETGVLQTWRMFTGTVDSWQEAWKLRPQEREAQVVASDATKTLVNLDWGEQPAVGAGDTVAQRIERILTYYGYTGSRNLDTSAITLQATTLAQSGWELIGRATDDELGFVWIDRLGVLQFRNRDSWKTLSPPVLEVGCPSGYDAVTDAQVTGAGRMRNAIYAGNTGGAVQVARSEPSISLYGPQNYKRTDLGMQNNSQAAAWATFLLQVNAYPRPHIDTVTITPRFTPAMWPALLGLRMIQDRVRVQWQPPGEPLVDAIGRVLGVEHSISRHSWEVDVSLTMADLFARVFHWGPHPNDRLTQGNVWL